MYRTITAALIMLLCLYAGSASAFELREFTASFEVKKAGLTLGTADFELRNIGSERWRYASLLRPSRLARMFIDATFRESSEVQIKDGTIMPLRYDFRRTGDEPESASILFDWPMHEAQVMLDGKASTRKLIANSQDHYSLVLNLMQRTALGQRQFDLNVHSKDEELYHYHIDKQESVKTDAGKFDAVKIIQRNSHNSRELHYWLAPKLNYMPIKIEQYYKGGRVLQMRLTAQKIS